MKETIKHPAVANDPKTVLKELFEYASVDNCKTHLKEWLEISLSAPGISEIQRESLVYMHEHFVELVGAAGALIPGPSPKGEGRVEARDKN